MEKETSQYQYGIFEPILGERIHLGHVALSGNELMARLFVFIERQQDKRTQQTLKFSLVNALSDCMEDGQRVCHPGKIQRLMVSVVQGYLGGTNIDIPQITTAEAVHSFFLPPNRQVLTNPSQLHQEAEQYLVANRQSRKRNLEKK